MSSIHIEHELPIAAAEYWEILHDPEFEAMQAEHYGLGGYTELDRKVVGNVMTRRVLVTPKAKLPEPVAKLIGQKGGENNTMGYVEVNEKHLDRFESRWWIEPPALADKLQVGGTFRLQPIDDNRCLRILDGEVKVKIFGIGAIVEQFIAKETRRTYDKAPGLVAAWKARKR